jgi:glycosyltransferase involved in cell wall biosynthesis
MRVVRVLGKLEPGGAQLAILRLSRELERRHGVDARLLVGDATSEGIRLARHHGIEAEVYRTSSGKLDQKRNLQWQRSLAFATWLADKVTGADVVHAHMVGAWWAVAQVVDASTSFVATEHNQVNWAARRVRGLRPAAVRIDRFYAMGPAASRFAIAAGVRPEVIRPARSAIAGLHATPRLGLRTPRLTFAGRFDDDKGADVLVEAIRLLQRPDLSAYLLGDGPLRAPLAARIRAYGLSDRVFTPGWTDTPWAYIAGSAVHVVPSREEAWSQSAVLGLGLGVPVIGTNVDGLADTLADSRGVIVSPDDPSALSQAISDTLALLSRFDRAGAIKYARQFTAARIAEFYFDEYETLLARETSTDES